MENIRDFAEFLTDLRAGVAHQELSIALQEVTEAATKTGKQGTVSLSLKIKPKGQQVVVIDTITKKVPEHDKPDTIMFFDDDFNLTRTDVRQMNLGEVKQVETKAEVVELDKHTGELREVGSK